jgi:LysM repeat protein
MRRLIITAAVAAMAAGVAFAGYNEDVVARMTMQKKRFCDRLSSLSPQSLQAVAQQTSESAMRRRMEELLALDSLAIGTRAVDADGRAAIHRYLLDRIAALRTNGVEYVGSMKSAILVPVAVNRLKIAPASGPNAATVRIGDRDWPLLPIWPNGALPNICPSNGLEGPLVYVQSGLWEQINGLDLKGAIALMDFRGGRAWDRLFSFGVKAVIVLEDDYVNRENAEGLFCSTPVPCPRFMADRKAGAELLAAAARRVTGEDGSVTVSGGATAKLTGGSMYESRPIESIFAYLPPTPPLVYRVKDGDLLERIAADNSVSTSDLLRENGLALNSELAPGRKLDIPNQVKPYVVREGDLLQRIANDYVVATDLLVATNRLTDVELKAGRTLVIPNLDQSIFVQVRVDSVSVVPDAPHGCKVAADVATALAAMEHLATGENIVRRKGVVFAFLDGDNYGGQASRMFAEHVLHGKGELRSLESRKAGSKMFRFFFLMGVLIVAAVVTTLTGKVFLRRRKERNPDAPTATKPVVVGAVAIGVAALGVGIFCPLPERAENTDSSEAVRLARYEKAQGWLKGGCGGSLPADVGRWFVEEWLQTAIEKRRVALAEERIRVVLALRETKDQTERARLEERRKSCEEGIAFLVNLRIGTVKKQTLGTTERAKAFFAFVREESSRAMVERLGLTFDRLLGQLEAEMADEVSAVRFREANIALVRDVLDRLHPEFAATNKGPDRVGNPWPVPGWHVDLSDGNNSIAFKTGSDARGRAGPAADHARVLQDSFRDVAAYAGVQGNWPEEWTFVSGSMQSEYMILPAAKGNEGCVYADFWAAANVALLPIGTINDRREFVDTSLDTLENANVRNLSIQARTVLTLISVGLESVNDSMGPVTIVPPKYARLVGRVLQFNVRSGIDAKDSVPGSWVYFPGMKDGSPNAMTSAGSRLGSLISVRLSGAYALPLETPGVYPKEKKFNVLAYRFDRKSGLFDMVMECAQIGTQRQNNEFSLIAGYDGEKNLILTAVYPRVLFPGADPMDYTEKMDLLVGDAVSGAVPRHYGMDIPGAENPRTQHREQGVSATIMYCEPNRRIRVQFIEGARIKGFLNGRLPEGRGLKGEGYGFGPVAGDRNLTFDAMPLTVARDMQAIVDRQMAQYRRFGIRDKAIDESANYSRERLAAAEKFARERKWQAAIGAARESWGALIKNYPGVMTLGREAVFSVVILMALLLPACIFAERLLIGAKTFGRHLVGAAFIFAVGSLFLNLFHPAFKIAVSPFIIVIAFTMILASVVVLGLFYQRFDVLVRRARISGGEVESEEISLASSLGTAFSLGVSNLKKRPTRTALTAFTVSALTFSIITFVSVKGRDTVFSREVTFDLDVAGKTLTPEEIVKPARDGVLIRGCNWADMQDGFVSAIRTEFGTRYRVVGRSYFVRTKGGNNAAGEGANQIEVAFGKRKSVLMAVAAFEPAEKDVSGLNKAVTREAWFGEHGAPGVGSLGRFAIILPDNAAKDLGITEKMIFDADGRRLPEEKLPEVRMVNYKWRVIGILDTARADRIRDVNGKSLAIVDYLRSAITPNQGGYIENESTTYHVSWTRMAIVPVAARSDVGAGWCSMAVQFAPGDDIAAFRDGIAKRLNNAMFSYVDGKLSLMTAKKAKSVGGLAKIVVPIILCILIVMNTMLGTVEERKGEVEMLGAIGLSPRQISFLLLSESAVFSVLGIIVGMFSGLAFATAIAHFPGFLRDLSFNFTSLASTMLAVGTGIVVLIATMVPARKAAAMAAPSGMGKWILPDPGEGGVIDFRLPFTLTRGNAVGMVAFFRRFLLNHTEATSLDFNCRDVAVERREDPDPAVMVGTRMWLAPYDLDVAQELETRVVPTEKEGIFSVVIHLRRVSGTEEAWLRTNYRFIDLVRQQFLLWRNLDKAVRGAYIEEGARLLAGRSGARQAVESGKA